MEPTLIEKQNKRYGTDWETAIKQSVSFAKQASGMVNPDQRSAYSQTSLPWIEIAKFLVPND